MKLRAEFAKSSRSRCRACGRMIQGGTIRWAKENEEDDIRPQYTHLSCLNLAKGTRENLTEKDIIFDADFTKKQRDAIVEAFHLTAEEEPEQRRMEAVKRHEVAPEKRKDKPDYMEDEGENEGETEEKKEQEEDEDDEEYVEEEGDEDEKEEADEEEYMEEDEIEGDLEEVKAEAAEFQQPNKRRKKNEETEQKGASEEKASGTRQKTRASGRTQKSKTGEGDQGSEGERSDEEQEEKGSEDAKQTKETKGGRNDKNQESAAKKYENMGSDELKEYLRANKQIMSGTQEDLRKRCIDCELYGALPTCPQCEKGRLIKNEQTGKVECHGYYDEDAGMPAKCGFNEDEKKIQRRPWREPSEAPPVLFNVHIKGEEGPASLTAEVKKKLDSIVGSKNLNKRDTARELMKYGRESELELPKDDDEAIDAIEEHLDEHTENSNIDYEAAFAEIAREYSKDPEIKGMRKSKSRFDKNEKIADALNELATLYGKLGGQDRFRARAEKKAAGAVRSLDFEIRSGKELSEGDTKIEGIGHDTGEMIDEFLQTGKIEKLEDARKRVKEQKSD